MSSNSFYRFSTWITILLLCFHHSSSPLEGLMCSQLNNSFFIHFLLLSVSKLLQLKHYAWLNFISHTHTFLLYNVPWKCKVVVDNDDNTCHDFRNKCVILKLDAIKKKFCAAPMKWIFLQVYVWLDEHLCGVDNDVESGTLFFYYRKILFGN